MILITNCMSQALRVIKFSWKSFLFIYIHQGRRRISCVQWNHHGRSSTSWCCTDHIGLWSQHVCLSWSTYDSVLHKKLINLTLKSYFFNGNNQMKMVSFLTNFKSEANMLNKLDVDQFIENKTFLGDADETQFRTRLSGANINGLIRFWTQSSQ